MADAVTGGLSVVVPTRDRAPHLGRCLASLRRSLEAGDELIVVDSASSDRDELVRLAAASDAVVVRCEEPGTSRARNAGWRSASHPVVAFVDDDVEIAPEWAREMKAAFAADPGLGFVTGRIEVPPGQEAIRPIALKDEPEAHPIELDRVNHNAGHGANLGVRREALEAVGGFDERLGPGATFRAAEDLDLYDRLLIAGWRGRYEPAARGWHDQWRSRSQILKTDWGYGFGGGARIIKLLRSEPSQARDAAAMLLWTWGVRDAWRDLRHGRRFLAATAATRVAGVVVGAARSLPVRVRGGHMARARSWRAR